MTVTSYRISRDVSLLHQSNDIYKQYIQQTNTSDLKSILQKYRNTYELWPYGIGSGTIMSGYRFPELNGLVFHGEIRRTFNPIQPSNLYSI